MALKSAVLHFLLVKSFLFFFPKRFLSTWASLYAFFSSLCNTPFLSARLHNVLLPRKAEVFANTKLERRNEHELGTREKSTKKSDSKFHVRKFRDRGHESGYQEVQSGDTPRHRLSHALTYLHEVCKIPGEMSSAYLLRMSHKACIL